MPSEQSCNDIAGRTDGTHALSAWEHVCLARSTSRPGSLAYVKRLFRDFFELHGDRCFADDRAVVTGIGRLKDIKVTVIAQQKGGTVKDRAACNYGMSHPEGFRKAMRAMRQAEKFGRPILCFIDTPGAYCDVASEERGQASAIAQSLYYLSAVRVPVITAVVGQGGSGGAMALSLCDRLYILENSIYTVLAPEGCASILWHDPGRAPEAAEHMKLTSGELLALGFPDAVLPEPENAGGGQDVYSILEEALYRDCIDLLRLAPGVLVSRRQQKYLLKR